MPSSPILLITKNFPPLAGGIERLIYHVYLELKKDRRVVFLGPSGSEKFLSEEDVSVTCKLKPVWRYLYQVSKKGNEIAKKCKPTVVIAGSGVMAPAAIRAGRTAGASTICFVHGLDIIYSNPIYRKFFVSTLSRFDLVIANSLNTSRLAVQHGVPKEKVKVLNPGVSIQNIIPERNCKLVLEKYHLEGKRLLISVGRIVPRKGIAEFIEKSLPEIITNSPDALYVVVGSAPNTKEARRYLSLVQKIIVSTGMGGYVRQLGSVSDSDLSILLSMSRLMVFPVLNFPSDVEGFGMVALEAASHGIPTVAFDVGGVSDAISDTSSGFLINSGDYVEFTTKVNGIIDNNIEKWRESSREFARNYSWEKYGERLGKLVSDLYV